MLEIKGLSARKYRCYLITNATFVIRLKLILLVFDKIKEKLRKAILKATDKILDALDVVDVKLRQKVKDLIVKGKVKIDELKEKVLELLDKLGHKAGELYNISAVYRQKCEDENKFWLFELEHIGWHVNAKSAFVEFVA